MTLTLSHDLASARASSPFAPSLDTICVRAGGAPDPESGALVPSTCSSTTFAQSAPGLQPAYCYGRTGNPTRERLEDALAQLEGARYARTFASGLAAVDTLLHTLSAGDHVVASQDLYGGCYRQFTKVWSRFGVTFSLVDATDLRVKTMDEAYTRYYARGLNSAPLTSYGGMLEKRCLPRLASQHLATGPPRHRACPTLNIGRRR